MIQKFLDLIESSSEDEYNIKNYKFIIELITPNIIQFSNDLNACHIIQKIFISKHIDNKFLFDAYSKNITKITNDKNGVCFLQKCIDKLNEEDLNNLLEIIFSNIKEIFVNKYGNYVVQYIIKNIINNNTKKLKKFNFNEIFKFIFNDFISYSNQKYSSNVIEKLFTIKELKNDMIQKIKNPEIIKALLLENYGNYVVQKGLNYAENDDRNNILAIIGKLSEELKQVEFGNKLLNKLMIKYPNLIDYMSDKNVNNNFNNINKPKTNKENNIINNNENYIYNQNNINNNNINNDKKGFKNKLKDD